MTILLTGGLGFIGSHTAVELLNEGHDVIIVDNLSNSKEDVYIKIRQLGKGGHVVFKPYDTRDEVAMDAVFKEFKPEVVIHFAGLKAVGESMEKPDLYYEWNLESTISLLKVMKYNNCKKIIFSSTATVYFPTVDLDEDSFLKPTNTYANTKYLQELMLKDLAENHDFNVCILRYFNPIGAHPSGLIGENPNGRPNNLMPYINKVAIGELPHLNIFGNDYDTWDGTGVRDYIHVVDLAKAHTLAINYVNEHKYDVFNIGTGKGYSVLDIVKAYENANDIKIHFKIADRRPGDTDMFWSKPYKAMKYLGWKPEYTLEDMCRDSYNFIRREISNDNEIDV